MDCVDVCFWLYVMRSKCGAEKPMSCGKLMTERIANTCDPKRWHSSMLRKHCMLNSLSLRRKYADIFHSSSSSTRTLLSIHDNANTSL